MTRPRRARGGGYGSSWIRADKRLAIYLRDAFVCAYCGQDTRALGGPTLDHVDATGSNDATNLVVACRPCNNRKGDTALSAFLTSCASSPIEARAIRTRIGRRTAAPIARHLADARAKLARRKLVNDLASMIKLVLDAEMEAGAIHDFDFQRGWITEDGRSSRSALRLKGGDMPAELAEALARLDADGASSADDDGIPF
jgi:hypothetical protein